MTKNAFEREIRELRPPDLQIGYFSLWIFSEPDDDDWLNVLAACHAPSATVTASGTILQLADLKEWAKGIDSMYRTLAGSAYLRSAEPNIAFSMTADKLGNIEACIEITPEYGTQFHSIKFQIDQSYLPKLIQELNTVLARFH